MEIVVNVKIRINTISKSATPESIMKVTSFKIDNMQGEETHEVIDWELVEKTE